MFSSVVKSRSPILSRSSSIQYARIHSDIILNLKERKDSLTEEIIQDRERNISRLKSMEVDGKLVQRIIHSGLGKRKAGKDAMKFQLIPTQIEKDGKIESRSLIGAEGFVKFLGSAAKNYPIFTHMLPEIAVAGHSNCGKSTLVNSLSGRARTKGLARVSERAGWTDQVMFYQLGKKPPLLTLVDLPGYGHAVASEGVKIKWLKMIENYFAGRLVVAQACILIDCSRGICKEDIAFFKKLNELQIPQQIVLTKCDVLSPTLLANCIIAVQNDISEYPLISQEISLVSGHSGAGVQNLWHRLVNVAKSCSDVKDPKQVPVHRDGHLYVLNNLKNSNRVIV